MNIRILEQEPNQDFLMFEQEINEFVKDLEAERHTILDIQIFIKNDLFVASDAGAAGNTPTWSVADTIDGGKGTEDTLKITNLTFV